MIIKSIEFSDNADASVQMIVRGRAAIDRLNNRIIPSEIEVKNVESAMKDIVRNNTRDLTNLIIEDTQGIAKEFEATFFGEELVDALHTLSRASNLGFYLHFHDHEIHGIDEFRVIQGRDLTEAADRDDAIVFSENHGNLVGTNVTKDISMYKNVAYVRGADFRDEHSIHIVGDAIGDDRREMFVNAQSIRMNEDRLNMADELIYHAGNLWVGGSGATMQASPSFSAFNSIMARLHAEEFNYPMDTGWQVSWQGITGGGFSIFPANRVARATALRDAIFNHDWNVFMGELHAYGAKALLKRTEILSVVSDIILGQWGEAYFMGDRVTLTSEKHGVSVDAKIVSFVENAQNGKVAQNVMFGDKNTMIYDEMRLRYGQ